MNELVAESLLGASGVIYQEFSGKAMAKELNENIQSFYTKECAPTNYDYPFRCWQMNKDYKCEIIDPPLGSEWKYCRCTVFVEIPGGRKSIVERAIAVEENRFRK